MNKKDILDAAIKCLQEEADSIRNLSKDISTNFYEIIKVIINCKGKCILTGVGKSGHIAAKIAATLASTGTPSFYINPLDAYHGDLGMIDSNDIIIAISNSGNTDELVRIIPQLLQKKIILITMTSNPQSLLSKYSTFNLNVTVEKESDPLNLVPTTSTTAALAMGDAIACALIVARQFKAEDFALNHPGGSLGKRLLGKVKDYMVTTHLPLGSIHNTIEESLFKISSGGLGILIVVDNNNNFVGLISDGDIRRIFQKYKENAFSMEIESYINKKGICVSPETYLIDVEKIFSDKKIATIVVLNEEQKPVGVIESKSIHF